MYSQYFGNYLLKKGTIKPGQLADALEYQRSVHLKLGVIAVNAGYMTPAQVQDPQYAEKGGQEIRRTGDRKGLHK